jgi:hypothetical protein
MPPTERCWLEWWANSSTRLGSVEVAVTITAEAAGWQAHGRLIGVGPEDREGFAFLCELDPVFTLRFTDGSTFAVVVHPAENDRFSLTEYTRPVDRRSEP